MVRHHLTCTFTAHTFLSLSLSICIKLSQLHNSSGFWSDKSSLSSSSYMFMLKIWNIRSMTASHSREHKQTERTPTFAHVENKTGYARIRVVWGPNICLFIFYTTIIWCVYIFIVLWRNREKERDCSVRFVCRHQNVANIICLSSWP